MNLSTLVELKNILISIFRFFTKQDRVVIRTRYLEDMCIQMIDIHNHSKNKIKVAAVGYLLTDGHVEWIENLDNRDNGHRRISFPVKIDEESSLYMKRFCPYKQWNSIKKRGLCVQLFDGSMFIEVGKLPKKKAKMFKRKAFLSKFIKNTF